MSAPESLLENTYLTVSFGCARTKIEISSLCEQEISRTPRKDGIAPHAVLVEFLVAGPLRHPTADSKIQRGGIRQAR